MKQHKDLIVFIDMEPNTGPSRVHLGNSGRLGEVIEVQVAVKGPWFGIRGPATVESYYHDGWLEWIRTSYAYDGTWHAKPKVVAPVQACVGGR